MPKLKIRMRGYGATAARLTPDQKVASSNLSALNECSLCTLREFSGGDHPKQKGMDDANRSPTEERAAAQCRMQWTHTKTGAPTCNCTPGA